MRGVKKKAASAPSPAVPVPATAAGEAPPLIQLGPMPMAAPSSLLPEPTTANGTPAPPLAPDFDDEVSKAGQPASQPARQLA